MPLLSMQGLARCSALDTPLTFLHRAGDLGPAPGRPHPQDPPVSVSIAPRRRHWLAAGTTLERLLSVHVCLGERIAAGAGLDILRGQ